MKAKCYLNIDFEDANHDFKRAAGVDPEPELSEDELWASYRNIEDFCQRKLSGVRLTFFCTGVIAEKCPEIISQIAQDGCEIGCHFHYHESVLSYSPGDFERCLQLAIHHLELASKQSIKGFRAPFFSLSPENHEHFYT